MKTFHDYRSFFTTTIAALEYDARILRESDWAKLPPCCLAIVRDGDLGSPEHWAHMIARVEREREAQNERQ